MKSLLVGTLTLLLLQMRAVNHEALSLTLLHDKNYANNKFKKESDEAFQIASEVLNSAEFKQDMEKEVFVYHNHCKSCLEVVAPRPEKISGKEVLETLFKKPKENLSLILIPGESDGPLGETCPAWTNPAHETTTYYNAINYNMKELEFRYRLAVNICHEYMHLIGYCHPDDLGTEPDNGARPNATDFKNDIAYHVGWEAYYILLKRQQTEAKRK